MRDFMCSSHTVSGVMPGGSAAARHPLDQRLSACAAAGYSGYWLHWRDYLEQRAAGLDDAAVRDLFDRHGMRHRGVEFLTDWFQPQDAAAAAAERAAFAAAAAIGATVVSVGADFRGRGIPRREMVAHFERLCARAGDRGLVVALEFVPFSDVPGIRAALDFLAPPNAGLVVDCWHLFRGETPLDDLALVPPGKILCVQVSDAAATPAGPLAEETRNRLACGDGAFDLAGFAAAIDRHAPGVPVSVEIISPRFAAMSAKDAASESLRGARAVFAGPLGRPA
jgi:sugar phosphate isomerase/epimerase